MIFGRLAWDGPRCAVTMFAISSDVTRSSELEKQPSPKDAGLGDKRKNLPIPYEARLWQSWTILAVSVGWGLKREYSKKITGSQYHLLFKFNHPKAEGDSYEISSTYSNNEHPHLGTRWNDGESGVGTSEEADRSYGAYPRSSFLSSTDVEAK